jgi:hypothetical protein
VALSPGSSRDVWARVFSSTRAATGLALVVVGVQQFFGGVPAHDGRELPAQIGRVLNAEVHALTTERRMNVGGIACDEHPSGDGPRVFVGSVTPSAVPLNEAVLAELTGEGYSLERAAQAGLTMVHYVTGSVIEEQARAGLDYAENPYALEEVFDPERFPLSAKAFDVTFNPDADAGFEAGLAIVLAGIAAIAKT